MAIDDKFTDSNGVRFCALLVEVASFLKQKHEDWAEGIHPADIFRVFNEVRREKRSDRCFYEGQWCDYTDVIGVIPENIFRVKC